MHTGLRQIDGWVYCTATTKVLNELYLMELQRWNQSTNYFKLLLHILDDRLAVEADKGGADQFRVDRMGADHLTRDLEEAAYAGRLQLSHLVLGADVDKTDVQLFLDIEIGFVSHVAVDCPADERIDPESRSC